MGENLGKKGGGVGESTSTSTVSPPCPVSPLHLSFQFLPSPVSLSLLPGIFFLFATLESINLEIRQIAFLSILPPAGRWQLIFRFLYLARHPQHFSFAMSSIPTANASENAPDESSKLKTFLSILRKYALLLHYFSIEY